jgi:hypothetical protein
MPEVESIQKLLSFIPKKRFWLFNQYGTSQYGFSHYGDEDIIIFAYRGVPINFSGIYRSDNVTGVTKYYREPYYITRNPRTPAQQVHRQKYADGILAWQNLTRPEKELYNKRAKGKHYSGFNLFLKEYLLS